MNVFNAVRSLAAIVRKSCRYCRVRQRLALFSGVEPEVADAPYYKSDLTVETNPFLNSNTFRRYSTTKSLKTASKNWQKKELLPIDLPGLLGYILDNGSGDFDFNFATIPIIR